MPLSAQTPRMAVRGWLRRALPWLGTLVDIGVPVFLWMLLRRPMR